MLIEHVRPWRPGQIRMLPRFSSSLQVSAGTKTPVTSAHYHDRSISQLHATRYDLLSRPISDLGLRSQRPPDSVPDPEDMPSSPDIPDHEWEIRTGRAIFVIQETLPEFFETGLVTSINESTGLPSQSSSLTPNFLEDSLIHGDEGHIYSPNIRMSYTPPSQLPAPFPKTFHIQGLQLYLASSGIIRRTMIALHSDLSVKTSKLVINAPPSIPLASDLGKRRLSRQKSIRLLQVVTGISRVSGKVNEWEIESTYTFSPATGLINKHVVNSILPAPHLAVYDSLRLTLGKLLGWEPQSAATNGAAYKGDLPDGKI